MARLKQTAQALLDTRPQISAALKAAPPVDSRASDKAPTFTREHKGLATVYGIHGICELQKDRGTTWAAREPHRSCSSENTRLQGSQSSSVPCLGTVAQWNRPGDSDEHRRVPMRSHRRQRQSNTRSATRENTNRDSVKRWTKTSRSVSSAAEAWPGRVEVADAARESRDVPAVAGK